MGARRLLTIDIDELSSLFPDKCASLGEPLDSIYYRGGSRKVIDLLISRYEEQQEDLDKVL